MINNNKKTILTLGVFLLAIVSRLIPHISNFTAIESIALFGGAYFSLKRVAFLLPLIAIFFTDMILNNTIMRGYFPNHEGIVWFDTYMIWNILAMLGIVIIGRSLMGKVKPKRVLFSAVGASILFFIVSNLGTWLSTPMYTKDISGLIQCFTLAIPFFATSLLSSVVFSFILFGAYEISSEKWIKSSLIENKI